jgi:hypothetical protein
MRPAVAAERSFAEAIESGQICVVRSRAAFVQFAVFYGFVAAMLFIPSWHPEVWWVWRLLSPAAGCAVIGLIVVMWRAGWTIRRDGIVVRNYLGRSVLTPWPDVEWVGYDTSGLRMGAGYLALRTSQGRRVRTQALVYYSEKSAQPLIDNLNELRTRSATRMP